MTLLMTTMMNPPTMTPTTQPRCQPKVWRNLPAWASSIWVWYGSWLVIHSFQSAREASSLSATIRPWIDCSTIRSSPRRAMRNFEDSVPACAGISMRPPSGPTPTKFPPQVFQQMTLPSEASLYGWFWKKNIPSVPARSSRGLEAVIFPCFMTIHLPYAVRRDTLPAVPGTKWRTVPIADVSVPLARSGHASSKLRYLYFPCCSWMSNQRLMMPTCSSLSLVPPVAEMALFKSMPSSVL
mmetsp:Transcript_107845/g.336342  ORF Transcript_107845/g.336342 Transcript_107845/m.336342 type:complete len:239 (-) Transcript_107845:81-797(-)